MPRSRWMNVLIASRSAALEMLHILPPIKQGRKEGWAMQWEFVVALAIAIPIILFPAAFLWYLSIGGIYAAIRETIRRRAIAPGGGP